MADGNRSANSKEFYLEEYKALRKEIESLSKETRSLERNVIISIGLVWVWLLNDGTATTKPAWLFPILLAVLGCLRAMQIERHFKSFNEYIGKIEASFSAEQDPGGWEHFLFPRRPTRLSTLAFWWVLVICTVAVAIWKL
jgi:hypothetical protein